MSNYEKMKRQMQSEFLKYNQDSMIKKFPIDADEEYLTFDFMGGLCRVHRQTGFVECKYIYTDVFQEADYNEAMTVYDLLCYSKSDAVPAGQFVNMKSISKFHTALSGSASGFYSREAQRFDKQNTALCDALEKLGGTIDSSGDVAAQIPVFCGLNLLFRFWNSDDEFEPEIQFLWDANVLAYMHYETVWFANGIIVRRVCEIMEKQSKGVQHGTGGKQRDYLTE